MAEQLHQLHAKGYVCLCISSASFKILRVLEESFCVALMVIAEAPEDMMTNIFLYFFYCL